MVWTTRVVRRLVVIGLVLCGLSLRESGQKGALPKTLFRGAKGHTRLEGHARLAVTETNVGLDGVEIVMDVEDHFGITIQTAEAERVRTVGDLVSLIRGRIAAACTTPCPTLPAFIRVRAAVREAVDDNSFRIRPRQRIVDRLNTTQRRQLWSRLSTLLGSPARELRRPVFLRRILGTSVAVLIGVAVLAAAAIDVRVLPLTLALAAVCALVLQLMTVPLRSLPPAEWETFGDITAKLVGVATATKQLHLETQDDILTDLRPLIVEVLGVDASEVVPEARFVEDLGVG